MALIEKSSNNRRYFAAISKGVVKVNVFAKDENGKDILDQNGKHVFVEKEFRGITGELAGIAERSATVNGIPTTFVDITLRDGSEEYVLSFNKQNSVFESIVMSLATIPSFKGHVVSITPWLTQKDGKAFTNVSVKVDGEKTAWAVEPKDRPDIPIVRDSAGNPILNGAGQPVRDWSKRVAFVMEWVAKIQQQLAAEVSAPISGDAPDIIGEDVPDDLPA